MAFEEFIKGEVDYAQDISDIPRGNKRKCGGEKPLNRLADSDILCLNSADDFRDYLKEYFLSAATYQVLLMFARKLTVNLAGAEDLLHDAIEVLYTKYIDNEGYRKIDGLSMKDAARLLSQYVRTVMIRMHLSIVR
ncbi:hypothetical protein KKG71_02415, partial [Patescibacteria group bacterium]|nr:hypothetical protein [Patescibacteria group bacterium]